MLNFLQENKRWLATGLLLALGSSFGQTYFISFFAGAFRSSYGLTNGEWGLLYTLATLSSAALLLARGSLADTMPLSRLAPIVALIYAGAALLMAVGWSVWTLALSVFLLRFCGQGMFIHIKVTAMARWFVATRGRAMALTNLGLPAGDMLLPFLALLLVGAIGWRGAWAVVALCILLLIVPALMFLLAQDRSPTGDAATSGSPGLQGRHWRRSEALRHWSFWALAPLFFTPGFIGTVIFFHQVHISEIKGWTLTAMASAYPVFAAMTIGTGFIAGWACDRFGPAFLLPVVVLPMGVGIAVLSPTETTFGWMGVLGLIGVSQGMSAAVMGTLLPWAYGTNHLGAIRSVATALQVLSTAVGPGVTGIFIDVGVPFPEQGPAMALWCLALSIGMIPVARGLIRLA